VLNRASEITTAETFIKKRPLLADTEGGLAGFKASGEMGDVTVDDLHLELRFAIA
jgi:hypothetical protein